AEQTKNAISVGDLRTNLELSGGCEHRVTSSEELRPAASPSSRRNYLLFAWWLRPSVRLHEGIGQSGAFRGLSSVRDVRRPASIPYQRASGRRKVETRNASKVVIGMSVPRRCWSRYCEWSKRCVAAESVHVGLYPEVSFSMGA